MRDRRLPSPLAIVLFRHKGHSPLFPFQATVLAHMESHPQRQVVMTLRERLLALQQAMPALWGQEYAQARRTLAVGWKQVRLNTASSQTHVLRMQHPRRSTIVKLRHRSLREDFRWRVDARITTSMIHFFIIPSLR